MSSDADVSMLQAVFPAAPREFIQQVLIAANGDRQQAARLLFTFMHEQPKKASARPKGTIVKLHDEYASTCGYCDSKAKGRYSYGMDACDNLIAVQH
jgi:hypothetical protein